MYSKISKCYNLHHLLRCNLQTISKNSVRPYALAKSNTKSTNEGDRNSKYEDSQLYSDRMSKVKEFYRNRNYLPLNLLENCIKTGTSTGLLEQNMSDGLFLLKCCGKAIIDGDINQKKNFAQTIWKTMLQGNTNVTHYNAYLSSVIENNEDVNIDEFLQQMQKGNIRPNIITYSKIIEYFCSNGKMEGAYDILEQMKSENMTIGESVFNSLILGNARINNAEGCKQVLDVMNENGMKRDVETYGTLLRAYTEMNLADEVENLLKEVKEKDMFINVSTFMDSFAIATHNKSDKIRDLVYEEFPEKIDVANGANAFRMLLVNKEYEHATKLILKIVHPSFAMAKILIENAPFDVAVEMTEECVKNDRGGLRFGSLLEACLDSENTHRYINRVLKYFENNAERISNPNTIRHLFEYAFNSDKVSNSLIANIINLGCNSRLPMKRVLKREIFPYLHNSMSALQIHERFIPHMNTGYMTFTISLMEYLIEKEKFNEAANYAEKTRFNDNLPYMEKSLFNALIHVDNKSYVHIARIIRLRSSEDSSRFLMNFDTFLQDIDRLEDAKENIMYSFIKALNSHNCFISTTNQEELLEKCKYITEESAKVLAMMSEKRYLDLPIRSKAFSKMNKAEADKLVDKPIEDIKTDKLSRLINFYIDNKDQENLTRVASELSERSERVNVAHLGNLLEAFCELDDVEEARKIWNLYKSHDLVPLPNRVFNYSTLLMNSNLCDEAIEALKVLGTQCDLRRYGERKTLQQLVMSSVENCTSEQRDELSAHLINAFPEEEGRIKLSFNYYSFANGKLSLEEMVSVLESCEDDSKFLLMSQFSHILHQCIESNNAELTKRVHAVDCSSHGMSNAMASLAFEFFMCGKTRQSAHLFQTFGLEMHDYKLEYFCHVIRNKDVNLFEEFLKVTNGVRLNRSLLYSTVLSAYANANDAQKALTVWIKAEEDNVEIDSKILYRVESLLKLNNLNVPFSIAKEVKEKHNNNTKARNVNNKKPRNVNYEKSRTGNDNISTNENFDQRRRNENTDLKVFAKVIRGELSVKDGMEQYNKLSADKRILCHDVPQYLDLKTDMEKGEYVKNLADQMEEAPNEGYLLWSLLNLEAKNPHSVPHLLRMAKTLSMKHKYAIAGLIFHKFLHMKNFDAALDLFESVVTTTNISNFFGNHKQHLNDIEFFTFVKDENRQDENLRKCLIEYQSMYFAKLRNYQELTEHIASTSQIHPFSNYNQKFKSLIENRIKNDEMIKEKNIVIDFLK